MYDTENILVTIEIPYQSSPIKYEIDKKTGLLSVDRIMPTTMFYPTNYGYINNSLSLDKDPLDALVITPYPLFYNSIIKCTPIGMLKMIDEKGEDCKILMIPHKSISKEYENIKNIEDISNYLKQQIIFFFENYKKLDSKKWVKIIGWNDQRSAKIEIIQSYERFQKKNKAQ
ncbi:inorganic diphosphatase [Buchnera aphidicola (Thelaxes californica)]|uniref:Inorganic pyrophosphatase n=1 Tax=Buchnera aphidicola (Thelaxes californica) TaxID=1315998 RepID=A0A4D6YA32_9GAMM|nr:inorganic diphosphatase [Buchnera aphidicola]QCI26627.1 inorganic diphosphatase [Buchnera aphidicola (Thelaxes californica)]